MTRTATLLADDAATQANIPRNYTPTTLVHTYRSGTCNHCYPEIYYHIRTPIAIRADVHLQYRIDIMGYLVGAQLPIDMTFLGDIEGGNNFWHTEINRNN